MSIDSNKLSNIYSINKIIKNDGTIDLTNLEVLSSLNDFIKTNSYTSNSSLKLNDEDLLEIININKNIDDARTFLEKIDTLNYTSTCSNNIELIIDTSNDISPPEEEEENVSPPEEEEENVSPPHEEENVSPPPEEEENVSPGIINSLTSLTRKSTRKSSSQPTRKLSSKLTKKSSTQPTRKLSSKLTKKSSSQLTRKKGTK
jgi:hypothetical protein